MLIGSTGVLKIADFGLSSIACELQGEMSTRQMVPIRHQAPETVKQPPKYSTKSDVFA